MQVMMLWFSKVGANIDFIEVSTSNFTGFIMEFTKTENILIIYKNKALSKFVLTQEVRSSPSTFRTWANLFKKGKINF